MNIDIEGIPELEHAANIASERIRAQLEGAIEEAARAIRDDARELVAYDTGDLHDGIGFSQDGLTAEIGVRDPNLYYGIFIEFGTSSASMPPRPFMQPAAELERARFVNRMKDAVKEVS